MLKGRKIMKVLVQRSKKSNVMVDNKLVNEIKSGLVLFVGFKKDDSPENIIKMVKKVLNLRIFDDENGVMNKSILDIKGEILSISQFTMYSDTNHGNRPSYVNAMHREEAIILYEKFNELLNKEIPTYSGVFGAEMLINIQNDGPITIILEN